MRETETNTRDRNLSHTHALAHSHARVHAGIYPPVWDHDISFWVPLGFENARFEALAWTCAHVTSVVKLHVFLIFVCVCVCVCVCVLVCVYVYMHA